ncbi:MAG: penicillin-binding protein 2 [Patescibacteria group bacterium]|nr:penicillin-binding protein 2 [Patescibacteria group bacterium]
MPELFPIGKNKIEITGLKDRSSDLDVRGEYNEFLDGDAIDDGPKSEFLRPAISEKRLRGILILCFCALFCLALRSGYVQIAKGAYYHKAAEENRIRTQILPSWRGIIYDRNQTPLVKNIPTFSISITPDDIISDDILTEKNERKEFLNKLGLILEIHPSEIEKIIYENQDTTGRAILIKENLEHDKAIALMVQSSGLKGVELEIGAKREYLIGGKGNGYSMSHILGYEGKINPEEYKRLKEKGYLFRDDIGKIGIELFYEEILRGQYGRKQIEVDAMGYEKNIIAKEDPINGENVVLTIDYKMQKKLEDIMISHLWRIGKRKASAIVMNPNNGEILAMVSIPSFLNNDFADGIGQEKYDGLINDEAQPLFSRSVGGEYPPGSTIKLIIAAAGLQEDVISSVSTILSLGGIGIKQWFFPDWKAGGHGVTSVKKAIAESVNTFFYYVGGGFEKFEGLGVAKIGEYLKLFGIGEKLGLDLGGEGDGFVPTKKWKEEAKGEQWYIGDTYHLAIGQGDVLVTPLQVASYTSVFANSGTLYKPHLVKETFKYDDVEEIQPEILRENFISEKNIKTVRDGMRQAVTYGSAVYLSNLGVSVAGKTGTAQWSTVKKPHAWFTGFAPFENPEIVITVLVEEAGEGSAIAVPIAKEFLQWYFYKN